MSGGVESSSTDAARASAGPTARRWWVRGVAAEGNADHGRQHQRRRGEDAPC